VQGALPPVAHQPRSAAAGLSQYLRCQEWDGATEPVGAEVLGDRRHRGGILAPPAPSSRAPQVAAQAACSSPLRAKRP
jgi:hypothetical protein